ncbi:HAD hydrolase family protein, partial [uncultured Arthrobacter sp.]|uniref:HAD family hydrolase n=1 Tax=uncultured Arthrobacter sp. TaxID=114050 RepID=UPI0032179A31
METTTSRPISDPPAGTTRFKPQRITAKEVAWWMRWTADRPGRSELFAARSRCRSEMGPAMPSPFLALATDFDETIALDSTVEVAVFDMLAALKRSGRHLILATGRELPDLRRIFPDYRLFDRIVAENGAVILDPSTGRERLLGAPTLGRVTDYRDEEALAAERECAHAEIHREAGAILAAPHHFLGRIQHHIRAGQAAPDELANDPGGVIGQQQIELGADQSGSRVAEDPGSRAVRRFDVTVLGERDDAVRYVVHDRANP